MTILLAVMVLSQIRLRYGANFADEAYYIAIPLRFVRGDVPFRDDVTTLFSMFAFISYPFLKLFTTLTGSTDGIILYSRQLFFAVQFVVAGGIFLGVRRLVTVAEALLIASCAVAFVPFNIPCLSYNTIAELGLTAALLAFAWGTVRKRPFLVASSGLLTALCIAVYPTLLVVGAGMLLMFALSERRLIVPFLLGGVAAIVLLSPFLIDASFARLLQNFGYYSGLGHEMGWRRIVAPLPALIWDFLPVIAASASVVFAIRTRMFRSVAGVLLVLLPVIFAVLNPMPRSQVSASHQFVTALGLTAPWVYLVIGPDQRRLLRLVWLPSAAAAYVMAISSGNGMLNAGIGFFPGAVLCVAMLLTSTRDPTASVSPASRWTSVAFAALPAMVLVAYQYSSVYWDRGIRELTVEITSGPYRSIRTTPEKARFAGQLARDIADQRGRADSVVFYHDFPAGYLFTDLQVAANTVWLTSIYDFPGTSTKLLAAKFEDPTNRPDLIVRLRRLPWGDEYKTVRDDPNHPIDLLLTTDEYVGVVDRSEYSIFARR